MFITLTIGRSPNKAEAPNLNIEVAFVDVLLHGHQDLRCHRHQRVGQDEGDRLGGVERVASVVVRRAAQVQRRAGKKRRR